MKKGEHKGRWTERGFRDYARIVDRSGSRITVRQSGLATERRVWIFCENEDGSKAHIGMPWRPWAPGATGEHLVTPAPHMGIDDAKKLVDALQRFIEDKP